MKNLYYKSVYLSYPYRRDPEGNRERIIKVSQIIHNKYPDLILVIPHLFLYYFTNDGSGDAMNQCLGLVSLCDELWICNNKLTSGMIQEYELANKLNKVISTYTDLINIKGLYQLEGLQSQA